MKKAVINITCGKSTISLFLIQWLEKIFRINIWQNQNFTLSLYNHTLIIF